MGPAPKEVMAAFIAHDLRDGEWVEVGANLPVPRAGALLAHLTHGPNLTVMLAMTKAYLHDEPSIEDFEFITDVRATRWAEAYYQHDRLVSEMRYRRHGVFYCGGLQFDAFGNSNLIGIGADPRALRLRGPGAVGTTNATVQNARYHLVAMTHSPEVLVERCDFISAVGYGDGAEGWREALHLPPHGPGYLITYHDVFGFPAAPVHDPCAVAAVIDSTIIRAHTMYVAIETGGSWTTGRTVCDVYGKFGKQPNARVGYALDVKRFWNIVIDTILSY